MSIRRKEIVMKALIAVMLASACWITSVVQWFQHDDHVALGWFGLSIVIGSYANYAARSLMNRGGTYRA
jgi:hypothetical protein